MTAALVAGCGVALVGLGWVYARARFGWLLAALPAWCAANAALSATLLLPAHPWVFGMLLAGFAAVPCVVACVVALDCRFGLFPLDTFYGLVAPIVLAPSYYVVNLATWALV